MENPEGRVIAAIGFLIAAAAIAVGFFGSVFSIADLLRHEWQWNEFVAGCAAVLLMVLLPIGTLLAIIGAIVAWHWKWYSAIGALIACSIVVMIGGALIEIGRRRHRGL